MHSGDYLRTGILECVQGLRPDEALEVSLKLPFAPGSEAAAPAQQPAPAPAAGGATLGGKRRGGLPGLGTLLPVPRFGNGMAAHIIYT